jgi:AraC family transcriptional regulator
MRTLLKLSCGQFYGEILANREVSGLRLAESLYPSNFRSPKHSHKQAYLCLIREGDCFQTYGARTRMSRRSSVLFHPPGEIESEHFGTTGGRIFHIELGSSWLERFREHGAIKEMSFEFQAGSLTWLMERLYHESWQTDGVAPLAIEGLMFEIIAVASRGSRIPEGKPPVWLEQAKELLHEQFHERLTLLSIGKLVGVHPVHLATTFRRYYGCTVGEYTRRRRIEFACQRIITSDATLVEIAMAAGFSNQAHFSRVFRRVTGMNPSAYRSTSHRA